MSKDSMNEMEQIQKGLEQFLEKEIEGYKEARQHSVSDDMNFTAGKDAKYRREKVGGYGRDAYKAEEAEYDEDEYPDEEKALDVIIPHRNSNEQIKRKGTGRQPDKDYAAPDSGRQRAVQKAEPDKRKKHQEQEEAAPVSKKKKKKKKSKIKRFLLTILVILVLLGGLWYYLIGVFYQKMNYGELESQTNEPMKVEGVVNILLIGNDSRTQGEDGRSDAMILLSISDATKTIHMTSLLRDMYVEIPGYKGNRLNAAYAYGGAELLMETIELNFGISVNRYMTVNFQAFANLTDAVGGVELELTNEEVIYINGYLVEYNILQGSAEGTDYLDTSLSGMVHLNGPQALAYCRNRYLGTDFGRTERQRKVLADLMKKAPGALLSNPTEVIDGFLPNLLTNLTQNECYQLSLMAGKLAMYDIIQNSIPLEGTYKNSSIRGMSVLEVDFGANKNYIRTEIYGD